VPTFDHSVQLTTDRQRKCTTSTLFDVPVVCAVHTLTELVNLEADLTLGKADAGESEIFQIPVSRKVVKRGMRNS
jgi:hypothetical protein